MTSIANQTNYPMRIPSSLPLVGSPIAKILNKPDLLALVFFCLDWDQRSKQMRTCRDFTIVGEKSVLDEMRKTTDLTKVFHKYFRWFALKHRETFPLQLRNGLKSVQNSERFNERVNEVRDKSEYYKEVYNQIVTSDMNHLNDTCTSLSDFKQSTEKRTLLFLRPILTQVFRNCPNLATINSNIFDAAGFVFPSSRTYLSEKIHWEDIKFEVLNISNLHNPNITSLTLFNDHNILSPPFLLHGNIYPNLLELTLWIENLNLSELEGATTFAHQFPRLESTIVFFMARTLDHKELKKEDVLRYKLPQLHGAYFSPPITNEFIEAVGENYPQLKWVTLHFDGLSDLQGIRKRFSFFTHFFQELNSLTIYLPSGWSADKSEEGLQIIGKHCKKLRKVVLKTERSAIKCETAINFCRNLPELIHFDATASRIALNFTLEEAAELIQAAPKLTTFKFTVKDEAIVATWGQEIIEEVRKSLRVNTLVVSHKRWVAALDEEEEKSSGPASQSALIPTGGIPPVETENQKAKKARTDGAP